MPRQDISRIDDGGLNRRDMLGFIGGTLLVSLLGCFRQPSGSAEGSAELSQASTQASTGAAGPPGCTVRPQQTAGPFFVDEGLNRSDIRSDPTTGAVKPGVPLALQFRVSQVGDGVCVPLVGAVVDVWHCDATGVYSDVADRRASTVGQKFLRGSQVTNADGTVEFITVYPGWYPGRTVHIHFKIRGTTASEQGYEFTSQLYFDDALSDRIYAQAPYRDRGQRTTQNSNDGIFRNGGEQLILPITQDGESYTGRFEIGLEL